MPFFSMAVIAAEVSVITIGDKKLGYVLQFYVPRFVDTPLNLATKSWTKKLKKYNFNNI